MSVAAGSIKEIHLVNFMAFDDVTLKAGRSFNIIFAPNGKGKSTILCGVILCMGGTPSVTGRSNKLDDYIRNDRNEALVEVTLRLSNDDTDLVKIGRKIKRPNKTTWLLDDRTVDQSEVRKLFDQFNIKVDNMCQVLPQDKVQDFSKMNQQQLMTSTLQTISRYDILDEQKHVVQLQKQLLALKMDSTNRQQELNKVQVQIDLLEKQLKMFEERRVMVTKCNNYNGKLYWSSYAKMKSEMDELETERTKTKQQYNELNESVNALKEKQLGLKNEMKKFNETGEKLQEDIESRSELLIKKIKNHEEKRSNLRRDWLETKRVRLTNEETTRSIVQLDENLERQHSKLTNLHSEKGSLDEMRKSLQIRMKEIDEHQSQIEQLQHERIRLENQSRQADQVVRESTRSLNEIRNVRESQLAKLQSLDKDAFRAYQWIQSNAALFKGRVFGPLIIEFEIARPDYAVYIEHIIPKRDLVAFIVTEEDDLNVFVNRIRGEQKLMVNFALYGDAARAEMVAGRGRDRHKSRHPIDELRTIGFYAYAIDMIVCENPFIREYLMDSFNLQNVPIGGSDVDMLSESTPSDIRLFFSATNRYAVVYSEYTNFRSEFSKQLRPSRLFVARNQDAIDALTAKVREAELNKQRFTGEIVTVGEKIKEIESKISTIAESYKSLKELLDSAEYVKQVISGLNERKAKLQSELVDEEQVKANFNKKLQAFSSECTKALEIETNMLKKMIKEYKNYKLAEKDWGEHESKILKLDAEIAEVDNLVLVERKKLTKILETRENLGRSLSAEKTNALKFTDNVAMEAPAFKKYEKIYADLPDDPEELRHEICEMKSILMCLDRDGDEDESDCPTNLYDDFEKKKSEIANLKKKMCRSETENCQLSEALETAKQKWLQNLQAIIVQINEKFSSFFNRLECRGEVVLYRGDVATETGADTKKKKRLTQSNDGESTANTNLTDKFDMYGLSIRVTYRENEPLRDLDRNVQSGGERAVATAMFILSLQDLTKSPFLWLDEINQGMDSVNETKLYNFMFEITELRDTQYFMITPKIVKDLKWSKKVTAHTIFRQDD